MLPFFSSIPVFSFPLSLCLCMIEVSDASSEKWVFPLANSEIRKRIDGTESQITYF
jgi:hypothetical protein